MATEVMKGGGGLWRMVEVGGIAAATGGFFLLGLHDPPPTFTNLHRPPAADVHAEYVKVPAEALVRVPDNVPLDVAAILCDAVATPFNAVLDAGGLRAPRDR